MKLVHVLLAELLERGQRVFGVVENFCYYITGYGIVLNISKGLPLVAAAVITQDNNGR